MDEKKHFDKIFWFIVACVSFVFLYMVCVTFGIIPKENQNLAIGILSFLEGNVMGAGIGYLLTGNANQKKEQAAGTTTADITATVTTSPSPNTPPSSTNDQLPQDGNNISQP